MLLHDSGRCATGRTIVVDQLPTHLGLEDPRHDQDRGVHRHTGMGVGIAQPRQMGQQRPSVLQWSAGQDPERRINQNPLRFNSTITGLGPIEPAQLSGLIQEPPAGGGVFLSGEAFPIGQYPEEERPIVRKDISVLMDELNGRIAERPRRRKEGQQNVPTS